MPRSLRPRTSKVDYSVLLDSDGGSPPAEEDIAEFVPEADGTVEDDQLSDSFSADADGAEEKDTSSKKSASKVKKASHTSPLSGSSKSVKARQLSNSETPGPKGTKPSESFRSKGDNDYRARTTPVFLRPAQVERLLEEPRPFAPGVVGPASAWNTNSIIADKISRAFALNVGIGPVWELLEDRSWWRESVPVSEDESASEAQRRPRVHENIGVQSDVQIISSDDASLYLPEGLSGSSPTPINCTFGRPGNEVPLNFSMLKSIDLGEHFSDSNAHVFWAGAPVFALDWCPIFAEDQSRRLFKQYIAVAPLPSKTHTPSVGIKCPFPAPSCIQLWSYGPKDGISVPSAEHKESEKADFGRMSCEMILCIENGSCMDLKWCPLPSNDSWSESPPLATRKLGLLGGVFEDGSLCIFAVPDPEDLPKSQDALPVFVKIQPSTKIILVEASICSFDWANSTLIAAGLSNGVIAVYDLASSIQAESMPVPGTESKLFPSQYISAHQSAIRSIAWASLPSFFADGELDLSNGPYIIASGGYDGCEMLTDIREGVPTLLNRTRDVVLDMSYSHFNEGIVTIDQDMVVKNFVFDTQQFGVGRVMMEATGAIWSLGTSEYHPMLAAASADGALYTTNMLKTIRRGGRQARLLCKVYEMDFNRKTGEYRMFDQLLPEEIVDRRNATKKSGAEASNGIGAWPQEVLVTCARWNNGSGLARAPLLASATSSGLCRIDWLTGRFVDKVVPFGGIDNIRESVAGDDLNDEED